MLGPVVFSSPAQPHYLQYQRMALDSIQFWHGFTIGLGRQPWTKSMKDYPPNYVPIYLSIYLFIYLSTQISSTYNPGFSQVVYKRFITSKIGNFDGPQAF